MHTRQEIIPVPICSSQLLHSKLLTLQAVILANITFLSTFEIGEQAQFMSYTNYLTNFIFSYKKTKNKNLKWIIPHISTLCRWQRRYFIILQQCLENVTLPASLQLPSFRQHYSSGTNTSFGKYKIHLENKPYNRFVNKASVIWAGITINKYKSIIT